MKPVLPSEDRYAISRYIKITLQNIDKDVSVRQVRISAYDKDGTIVFHVKMPSCNNYIPAVMYSNGYIWLSNYAKIGKIALGSPNADELLINLFRQYFKKFDNENEAKLEYAATHIKIRYILAILLPVVGIVSIIFILIMMGVI